MTMWRIVSGLYAELKVLMGQNIPEDSLAQLAPEVREQTVGRGRDRYE